MIRLGYEIGSGSPVDIPGDRHVAISGQTQRSGKTTTLEALIHRASHRQDGTETKRRAVAFVTKRAEGSFRSARPIAPYFRDSADWQFVSSILEAMLGERMKFERAWIIDACRGAEGLAGVLANVKRRLHGVREPFTCYCGEHIDGVQIVRMFEKKNPKAAQIRSCNEKNAKRKYLVKPAQGLNRSILTQLEAYLEIVIPQIERLPYTKTLDLAPGLNVMDLSDYSTELQQLVIRSVLEWVYERERDTVVVIPEAWEFIPQNRRSPVLLAAEELIRKGAAAGNFVWLDSQDIAGVHKNVLRSVGVWILGVQRELNEVKRTLGYVQGAGKIRPEAVMALGKGEFFAAYDQVVAKVYVQPFWISDAHAAAIARGDETVESAEKIWREMRRGSARMQGARPGLFSLAETDKMAAQGARDDQLLAQMDAERSAPPHASGAGGPQMLQILDQEKPEDAHGADSRTDQTDGQSTRIWREGAEISPSPHGDDLRSDGRSASPPNHPGRSGDQRERPEMTDILDQEKPETEGDEMWKERAEVAEKTLLQMRPLLERVLASHGRELSQMDMDILRSDIEFILDSHFLPQPAPADRAIPPFDPPQAVAIDRFTDAGYELLKNRLLADPAVLAALDAQRPVLRVSITRHELPIDGDSATGRLGILVSEGFFARPQPPSAILAEFKRRGWFTKKYGVGHLNKPLLQISRLGFLTLEADGYRAAPGAKVEVRES